ncbi:MAG: hypothetical protein AAGB18_09345 [Pseudomonadota bacterium]
MNINDFLVLIQHSLTVAALVGAIASAIAYLARWREDREVGRRAQVSEWRKLEVHRLLHSEPNFLTSSEVLGKLRDSSYETQLEIRKGELSSEEVRALLMAMVADGVLVQRHGDQYGVSQDKFDVGAVAVEEQLYGHLTAKNAVELIEKYPDHYTDEGLLADINAKTKLSITRAQFLIATSDIENRGIAHRSDEGKWKLGRKS